LVEDGATGSADRSCEFLSERGHSGHDDIADVASSVTPGRLAQRPGRSDMDGKLKRIVKVKPKPEQPE
jgi:hypothetical protein